jgi:hypothetical protein
LHQLSNVDDLEGGYNARDLAYVDNGAKKERDSLFSH